MKKTTDFGFKEVPIEEKAYRVREVFDNVATRYDLMNDLMSAGLHRMWKRVAIETIAIRPGMQVLDLASGTGDLARGMSRRAGSEGHVVMTDINERMLHVGRNKCIDNGELKGLSWCQCDAETLPYPNETFDKVVIGFGLRNVTDKDAVLREMYRVLKSNGKALVLEFSKPVSSSLSQIYDIYSFSVLPAMGHFVAQDKESYQYLAESIRKHPDQDTLAEMMRAADFESVTYTNLTGGVVAIHTGAKV
ncbi:MAG: bifunctional demethylmenaquinone methyltransferase/2-methoxy-6-polyprenyl-1,4-benzoquinol methylase UbiE [Gammaproteobacteria bacterium]|nr:bifunctional demethylmenaquinone methyltransferase/2-methoxy-6-polyprenyl-1,4-benzoquinol methylase UbiE [Gammaproteobacteria bacterium]HAN80946.1 bifunctional demethylmenaquinone methyltransferase/2-methoxy-6-polyprenyl-1,4-benzoquinol methylase UbiE [Gammaproteobacteria bacterium]